MRNSHRRARLIILLILLGCAIVYMIGNASVPLWDRDEPRYAQTSRQMIQSRDWVVPRLLDQVRTAKPILIYWCQAASMSVFGDNAFAARLPSVVAMLVTLIGLAIVICVTIGAQRAVWTIFILSTSGLVIAAAKMCLTDAVLLLWVTVAQVCLLAIYLRGNTLRPYHGFSSRAHGLKTRDTLRSRNGLETRDTVLPLIMWLAIGLGGLTKGPVVLGVQITTMIVLSLLDVGCDVRSGTTWLTAVRWWRRTRPILGLIIITLICGPWLYLVHQREPSYLPTILGHDVWIRAITPLEGHRGPPGFYLLTIWGTYFPWSLLLPATIVWACKRRTNPIIRFSLAAVVGPWIMFEIVQTKLAHYILPVFPFLSFLTADMLIRAARRKSSDLTSSGFLGATRGWVFVVSLLGLVPWLAAVKFQLPPMAFAAMAILTVLAFEYGRSVWRFFNAHRVLDAAATMGIGMLIIVAVLYGLYFPNATFLHISHQIARVLKDEGATYPGDVVMIDYKEDSLAFYQGGTIRRQGDHLFLLTSEPWEWPRWIVLTDRVWQLVPPAVQGQFDIVKTVRGLWYVKGSKIVDVHVIRRKSVLASPVAR